MAIFPQGCVAHSLMYSKYTMLSAPCPAKKWPMAMGIRIVLTGPGRTGAFPRAAGLSGRSDPVGGTGHDARCRAHEFLYQPGEFLSAGIQCRVLVMGLVFLHLPENGA